MVDIEIMRAYVRHVLASARQAARATARGALSIPFDGGETDSLPHPDDYLAAYGDA